MADSTTSSAAPQAARTEQPEVDVVRRAAFDALVAVDSRDAYANLLVPKLLRDRHLMGRDAALVTELVYGTLRARGTLDAIIAQASARPLAEVDPRVLTMLRLGGYQLLYTRVPAHAAVATTVGVARVAVADGPTKFVNAVLRRISERDVDEWLTIVAPDDSLPSLAVRHSHPEWIVRAFRDALGPKAASELPALLDANNARPTVHLAARPGQISTAELAAEVGGEPGRFSPWAVYLPGSDPGQFAAIRDRRAHVQDEGSQLVVAALTTVELNQSEPECWLDLCAGPGGKAALLGAIAAQRGVELTAVEVAEHRAELVRNACAGLPVSVVTADGRSVGDDPRLPAGGFDRVLIDAPCTGLGSLRRRAESRWRRTPADIPALTKLQRELLAAGARALRPGGVLVYSTCSPHLAETKVTVADGVRRHQLTQLDVRPYLPEMPNLGDGPTVQLWPHRHGTDAMYLAMLQR